MKEKSAAFAVGAVGYPCIELAARGHTHWSMALLGGVCVLALVWIARHFPAMPLVGQAVLGAGFITAAEFTVGMLVNLWLGWRVWDYSREFANVLGQICPLFSFFWFLLCLPVLAALKLRWGSGLFRSQLFQSQIFRFRIFQPQIFGSGPSVPEASGSEVSGPGAGL